MLSDRCYEKTPGKEPLWVWGALLVLALISCGGGEVVFYCACPCRRIREAPDPKKVLSVAQMWPIWINPSVGLVCGQCSDHCWRVTHTSLGPPQLPQPLQGVLVRFDAVCDALTLTFPFWGMKGHFLSCLALCPIFHTLLIEYLYLLDALYNNLKNY